MNKNTPAAVLRHRRVSYPGTGYAFHLVRCQSRRALRDYIRVIRGFTPCEDALADAEAYTAVTDEPVLPGVCADACGGRLREIYVVVTASADPLHERRLWHHEIGHAASFFSELYAACPGAAESREEARALRAEAPAFATELLLEALDRGDGDAVTSGFLTLFPEAAQ